MVHWPALGFPPPTIAARCGILCAAATAATAIAILKIRLYIVITLSLIVARCSPFRMKPAERPCDVASKGVPSGERRGAAIGPVVLMGHWAVPAGRTSSLRSGDQPSVR